MQTIIGFHPRKGAERVAKYVPGTFDDEAAILRKGPDIRNLRGVLGSRPRADHNLGESASTNRYPGANLGRFR